MYEWLQEEAKMLIEKRLQPTESDDPTYHFHRVFLHTAFCMSISDRQSGGRMGLMLSGIGNCGCHDFWELDKKKYSVETVQLLANIYGDFPRHISYISVHNRTVNMEGKPIDLMMEHYNL